MEDHKEPKPKPEQKHREKKTKKRKPWLWFIFVLVFTFTIAFCIGLASESSVESASLAVCCVIVLVLIFLAFIADVIAMAIVYADLDHFNAMASRRVKGTKVCIKMIKHSDRVANVLSDILGDICAIVSGAVGAYIGVLLIGDASMTVVQQSCIIALVAATTSAITVTAKALAKYLGKRYSTKIVFGFGKFLSLFTRNK